MNSLFNQVRKGDEFSFLSDDKSKGGFYTALSNPRPHRSGVSEVDASFTTGGGAVSTPVGAVDASDDHTIHIFEKENNTVNTDPALYEKLELASEYELQARFNYTNEEGVTRDRRLVVQYLDDEYVEGSSYDENRQPEGYRRFRLDRINGKVTIR